MVCVLGQFWGDGVHVSGNGEKNYMSGAPFARGSANLHAGSSAHTPNSGSICDLEGRGATQRVTAAFSGVQASEGLICPGYCGECFRPDWRFGMSGQRKYSMELCECDAYGVGGSC